MDVVSFSVVSKPCGNMCVSFIMLILGVELRTGTSVPGAVQLSQGGRLHASIVHASIVRAHRRRPQHASVMTSCIVARVDISVDCVMRVLISQKPCTNTFWSIRSSQNMCHIRRKAWHLKYRAPAVATAVVAAVVAVTMTRLRLRLPVSSRPPAPCLLLVATDMAAVAAVTAADWHRCRCAVFAGSRPVPLKWCAAAECGMLASLVRQSHF